jgi:hypothetical protein
MEVGLDANMEASRDSCDWSTFHVVLATSVQLDVYAGSTKLDAAQTEERTCCEYSCMCELRCTSSAIQI